MLSFCLTARNATLLLFIGMLMFSIIRGDVVQMLTKVSDSEVKLVSMFEPSSDCFY